MKSPETPAIRKRDASQTRAAIVDAARSVFSEQGFDGAGTREIAKRAGCNIALINRYFGSKAGLFQEVMDHCVDLGALSTVAIEDLPAALAQVALTKGKQPGEFDPMIAAIRSSSSAQARQIVKAEMGDPMVDALADIIGGPDAHTRAALVLSVIAGFDIARHLIGPEALADRHDDTLRPRLETLFQSILE